MPSKRELARSELVEVIALWFHECGFLKQKNCYAVVMPRIPFPEEDIPPLAKAEIGEIIAIWAEEFDEIITEEQAIMEMNAILELYWLLSQALPGDEDPQEPQR